MFMTSADGLLKYNMLLYNWRANDAFPQIVRVLASYPRTDRKAAEALNDAALREDLIGRYTCLLTYNVNSNKRTIQI